MIYFILGMIAGTMFFEPLIINLVYFSNVNLFLDIILWERNVIKLKEVLKND